MRALLLSSIFLKRAATGAALFFISAACGGAAPAPRGATSCEGLRFPYPPAAASLMAADAGRSVTVPVGGLVEVTLLGASAPAGGWPELRLQGAALTPLAQPENTATVGTRLGEYCAARPGGAEIESGAAWRVAVTVRP